MSIGIEGEHYTLDAEGYYLPTDKAAELGAAAVVRENTLKFTKAMTAYKMF